MGTPEDNEQAQKDACSSLVYHGWTIHEYFLTYKRKPVNPIITIAPDAANAIKCFLSEKGLQQPLRIDLRFSGCCDPALALCIDHIGKSDLTQVIDGLVFVISQETYHLIGEVDISYVNEIDRKGFIMTSRKPVSEWEGFGVCNIKV